MRSGVPLPTEALVPIEDLVKTPFYGDYLRPWGDLHGCAARFVSSEAFTVVSALRGPRDGAFDEAALSVYRQVSPHLVRALQISRRLQTLERQVDSLRATLDGLAHAVFLVDRLGRVAEYNQAAERLVTAGDGIAMHHGFLTAAAHAEGQALLALIQAAHQTARTAGRSAGGALSIRRQSGRPLSVLVSPLRLEGEAGDMVPTVAVFVGDPDGVPAPPERLIAGMFGLTPAEARVAAGLAQGETLQEIADRGGTSIHTVRAQTKALLAKTECSRQVELVARICRSLGWVRPD